MSAVCIILAGGLGTRLRSAVPDRPKCLAPIAGRPFLEWQLRSLAQRGVDRFVLALGYGADQVTRVLTEPWTRDFYIQTVIERESLGTGGAAQFAMRMTRLDEALIVNGDTFLGGSLQEMLVPLDVLDGEQMRMATVKVPDRSRFGGVSVNNEHCVTAFHEKGRCGVGLINAGLYRIHSRVFDGMLSRSFSLETETMPRLAAKGALQAREMTGPFIDIGVPDDYHLFNTNVHDYVHTV